MTATFEDETAILAFTVTLIGTSVPEETEIVPLTWVLRVNFERSSATSSVAGEPELTRLDEGVNTIQSAEDVAENEMEVALWLVTVRV